MEAMMWGWFNLLPLDLALWASRATMQHWLLISRWRSLSTLSIFFYGMVEMLTKELPPWVSLSSTEGWSFPSFRWHFPLYSTMWLFPYIMGCLCWAMLLSIHHCLCFHWFWMRICPDRKPSNTPTSISALERADRWTQKPFSSGFGLVFIKDSLLWSWVSIFFSSLLSVLLLLHSLLSFSLSS